MSITPHNQNAHAWPDSTCFGCKASTVTTSQAAMVTRNPGLVDRTQTEKEYKKNRPAYVRLKKEGLQPKKFTDAAAVEARAVSKYEIESGHNFKGDEKAGKRADEVQHAMRTGQSLDI